MQYHARALRTDSTVIDQHLSQAVHGRMRPHICAYGSAGRASIHTVSKRPRANTLNTLNTRQTDSQTAHREEELASDATSNNGCHNATGKTPQRSGQTYSCSTCTSALCRACRPLLCLHTAGPLLAHVLAVGQPTMLASRPPCAANHSARWRGWRW